MSGYAGLDLQTAVYNALVGDATLQTALGASGQDKKVYDTVPQNSQYPYVVIGDETALDWSTKSFNGGNTTMTMHVFTRGRGRAQCKAIIGHLHRILNLSNLSLTSNLLVLIRFEFTECFAEDMRHSNGTAQTEDLVTYHGVTRFRALTTQTGV